MINIDTLITARWVIPVEPADTVLEHHALAIDQGRIVELLSNEDALKKYRPRNLIKREQHVLLPGLINTHGHAAMSLMRGLADDLPLMEWLTQHIWPAEAKWVNPKFVYDGTLLACAEMLRSGTTCFNDMYFFPDEAARAAEHAGIRATVGLIVIDFPTAWAQNPDEYLEKGINLHDQLRHNTLINTAFAPHAPYTVSDAPLKRIATYAEELDIPVHIHLHETAHEVNESLEKFGMRPIARLEQLGLLTPRLLAVHMTQLKEDEISKIAQAGVHVSHCPESNLKLASGFCPVHKLTQAGINIALGTDGAASNNDLDMFSEMRTAALLAKAVAGEASAIPAHQALRMATINGAKALGIDEQTGTLEAGKAADVIAVNLSGIETEPLYHPASQLVYAASRDKVSDTWVAGNHLLKDGELTTIDSHAIIQSAREWRDKLVGLS
ncbi:MAG: TRZ/ATZ family hydrolase [Gammaproteobacteria bacterium]|nr:TRZ/ATZ family hydrolase [Gammaproteobacteria bacterium]